MWNLYNAGHDQKNDRRRSARSRNRYVLRLEPLEQRKLLDAGGPSVRSSLVASGNPAAVQNSSPAYENPALLNLYKAHEPGLNLPPSGTVMPPTLAPLPPATSQIPPKPKGFVPLPPPPPISYVLTQLNVPAITPQPAPPSVVLAALHQRTPTANQGALTYKVSLSSEGPFLNVVLARFGERSWHGFIVHHGPRVEHRPEAGGT